MFDNLIAVVGFASGIASLIGYLIDRAGFRSRWVHAFYTFVVVVAASTFMYQIAESKAQNAALGKRIEVITSIEYKASQVLKNAKQSTDGEKRGFILASLAFLERNKDAVPDSYALARQFALASGVLENKQDNGLDRLHQSWSLRDAADAMNSLLNGISAGNAYEVSTTEWK